jgi:predicted  nucleic acid-binding Zn-ribbon protein
MSELKIASRQLTHRLTAAHDRLQDELQSRQADLEAHQKGMEEAKGAHSKANEALAALHATKVADDAVLVEVKEKLASKEHLLAQAMADLRATSQIEERLRAREEEIEQVRAEHQEQLATLREQSSGNDEALKARHQAEIEVS